MGKRTDTVRLHLHCNGTGVVTLEVFPERPAETLFFRNIFSSRRSALILQIDELILQYSEYWESIIRLRQPLKDHTDNPWAIASLWQRFGQDGKNREIEEALRKVRGYETRTLEMIVDHFGSGDNFKNILSFLGVYKNLSERYVREAISYADDLKYLNMASRISTFHDVRSSGFYYADLSDVKGYERLEAGAALRVSAALMKRSGNIPIHANETVYSSYLTPEVTAVVRLYHDRVQDIIGYIEATDGDIDAGKLSSHLDAPVLPFAAGVL